MISQFHEFLNLVFGWIWYLTHLCSVRGVPLQTERLCAPEFTVYFADYLYLADVLAP